MKNWRVLTNDGTNVTAINNANGSTFSGTLVAYNAMLATKPTLNGSQLINTNTISTGKTFEISKPENAYQLTVSQGTVTAVVEFQVSNDGIGWITVNTITLTAKALNTSEGFILEAPWRFHRVKVISISGGTVVVTVGN